MTTLPAVPWTQRADLAALSSALGAGNLRWVGGAVRDTLLGDAVKDIDAATPLTPEIVIERLRAAGLQAIPTGIAHGTVTIPLAQGGAAEVTTLRHDVTTDGRHAVVAFASDWQEDAARRDFTMNALYADPNTLEVFDWFGGLADLAARRVRFIGDARQRIREDHLRILRYYRFQARFGAALDREAEAACTELAPMLRGLSRERIGGELQMLLALPDPAPTIARMFDDGVLPVVLPDAGPDGIERLRRLIEQEQVQAVQPDPLRRLAALLPSDPRIAEQVAAKLRLSSAQKRRLALAASRDREDDAPTAMAYRFGHAEALDRLLVNGQSIEALTDWQRPVFPLKGGAIVARGVAAGPEVARILQSVERAWVAEGFPAESRVQELLDRELSAARSE